MGNDNSRHYTCKFHTGICYLFFNSFEGFKEVEVMWIIISWIGSFGFAACAIPQVVETIRAGNAQGLSWGFLLLWLLGEVCTFAYVLHNLSAEWPLIVNYTVNGLCLLILIWYKWQPRRRHNTNG